MAAQNVRLRQSLESKCPLSVARGWTGDKNRYDEVTLGTEQNWQKHKGFLFRGWDLAWDAVAFGLV
jgi:hypothetical protein